MPHDRVIAPRYRSLYPWSGPIPVIQVKGTYYDMGVQHGQQTQKLVQENVQFTWNMLTNSLAETRSAIIRDLSAYGERIKSFHPGFAKEMEGIADGAAVSYEDILLLNTQMNLLMRRAVQEHACSAFAAWGAATKHGVILTGHNDDGPRFRDQFQVLLDARPEEGHRFCVPLMPGSIGFHTMVNETGLCAFGNFLEKGPQPVETRVGIPMRTIFRYLAQFEDNVESAIQLIRNTDCGVATTALLIDRSPDAAILHVTPRKISEIRSHEGDYLVVTNHALVDDVKPYLVLQENPSSSHYRFNSLSRTVKANLSKIDLKTGCTMLSSHFDPSVGRENPSGNSPCRHYEFEGKLEGTCRSAVVALGKREMKLRVALGNPCTAYWIELAMKYP